MVVEMVEAGDVIMEGDKITMEIQMMMVMVVVKVDHRMKPSHFLLKLITAVLGLKLKT